MRKNKFEVCISFDIWNYCRWTDIKHKAWVFHTLIKGITVTTATKWVRKLEEIPFPFSQALRSLTFVICDVQTARTYTRTCRAFHVQMPRSQPHSTKLFHRSCHYCRHALLLCNVIWDVALCFEESSKQLCLPACLSHVASQLSASDEIALCKFTTTEDSHHHHLSRKLLHPSHIQSHQSCTRQNQRTICIFRVFMYMYVLCMWDIHTYIYMYICTYTYICIYIHVYVRVRIMCVCACGSVYGHVCMYAHTYVWCMCMCV
jgi:hypothetical protein